MYTSKLRAFSELCALAWAVDYRALAKCPQLMLSKRSHRQPRTAVQEREEPLSRRAARQLDACAPLCLDAVPLAPAAAPSRQRSVSHRAHEPPAPSARKHSPTGGNDGAAKRMA